MVSYGRVTATGCAIYGVYTPPHWRRRGYATQALAQLLGVIKAPIGKFVRTLAEPHAKLVRTIAAVKDQKSAAA